MTGIQLSVGWAVGQAAEALAASTEQTEREAGRSLRCCEANGLDQLPRGQRESGTQGVRVALRFYREDDRAAVDAARRKVASAVAQAMGLWVDAVQLDLQMLGDNETWLGITRPYRRGGTGLRLDRYLTTDVLARLETRRGNADWRYLAERPAEVKILLRRLRYRLGEDFGAEEGTFRYAYWTTSTTKTWASQGGHPLDYLVNTLSCWSPDLVTGHADSASSLDVNYWGEVDTELDPLRVRQLTTETGTTARDVGAVLDHAGDQISHRLVETTRKTDSKDPMAFFVHELTTLLKRRDALADVDLLLVHRGGGLNPASIYKETNVPAHRRRELLELCQGVRDQGIEVVVALGHANISVLCPPNPKVKPLPVGIFEATTPTAGAAWILQEHINPRLVDTDRIFGQRHGELLEWPLPGGNRL